MSVPVEGNTALVVVSIAILWASAAYLAALGIAALVRPAVARRFLSSFAQTTKANAIECVLRLIVGLAFVGASSRTRDPLCATMIGWFLVVTAALLLMLPGLHRRFAAQATAKLFQFFPLFGLVSLALAAALLWFTL